MYEFLRFEYKVKAKMQNKGYIISNIFNAGPIGHHCCQCVVFWTSQRAEPGQRDQNPRPALLFIFVLSFSKV